MLILWIRRKKADKNNPAPQTEDASFKNHDAVMQRFRQSHPRLESTGCRDIMTPEGDILAAVHEVRLTSNAQN